MMLIAVSVSFFFGFLVASLLSANHYDDMQG